MELPVLEMEVLNKDARHLLKGSYLFLDLPPKKALACSGLACEVVHQVEKQLITSCSVSHGDFLFYSNNHLTLGRL